MTTTPRTPSLSELESSLEAHFYRTVRMTLGGSVYKMAPTVKGMPDRLVLLPGGRMYLVELKTLTGTKSPSQNLWHQRAAQLGTVVHTLYGRTQVDQWVRERAQEVDEAPARTVRKRSAR